MVGMSRPGVIACWVTFCVCLVLYDPVTILVDPELVGDFMDEDRYVVFAISVLQYIPPVSGSVFRSFVDPDPNM